MGLFYQSQLLLSLAVGVALLVLPLTVLKFPEPTFGAETLMRRVGGCEAALLALVSALLQDAAKR